jgi:hypothetical protein
LTVRTPKNGETLGCIISGNGIKRPKASRVTPARRGRLLDLNRIERTISFHKQVDLLPVAAPKEEERGMSPRIRKALVHLSKGVGLKDLSTHRAHLKRLRVAPASKVCSKAGIQKVHDWPLTQALEQVVRVGLDQLNEIRTYKK